MSITCATYDASFANLVSLVAYRDFRRSENQRFLRDQFHWLARFVFINSVSASLEVFPSQGVGLGFSLCWSELCSYTRGCSRRVGGLSFVDKITFFELGGRNSREIYRRRDPPINFVELCTVIWFGLSQGFVSRCGSRCGSCPQLAPRVCLPKE